MRKFLASICASALFFSPILASAQIIGQAVAGQDGTFNQRTLLTDATGRLLIVGSGAGGQVFGPDATGAAPTQPPVYTSGLDTAAHVRPFRLDTSGNLFTQGIETAGAAVTGGLFRAAGSDGTNARDLLTDTSGRLTVLSTSTDGGIYNTTLPTLTNTQRGDLQLGTRGSLSTTLFGANVVTPIGSATPVDSSAAAFGLDVVSSGMQWNGSTWDRLRAATSAQNTTGTGVAASSSMGLFLSSPTAITTGSYASQAIDGFANTKVVGSIASGATDSGAPVKTGTVYNTNAPTVVSGSRIDTQSDARGSQYVNGTIRLPSFSACGTGGGAGVVAQLVGSATKLVKVWRVSINGNPTVATAISVSRRSTASTGTAVTLTATPFTPSTTATSTASIYTVSGTAGTLIGNFEFFTTSADNPTYDLDYKYIDTPQIILSGQTDYLTVGSTNLMSSPTVCIFWTEE